ncbi:hypothetical protein [Wolbachia endosymbiont of Zygogramma bicolorata]|uniref:hypothetical protein n=1 Tax=Wolbachia endosymbiont of Zygogramma bicolorata TaxID=3134048 RepID=UPI003DA9B081
MLFPKRAVDRKYSFRLFTEKESAKDFDDIVLRYEQDGKIVHRFIQIKHKKGRHKKISIGKLLTREKGGAFSLIKYLIAYLKIKDNGEFEGEIEDFVIVTNADFDSTDSILYPVRKLRMMLSGKNKGKELSFVRIDTKDEFLDIGDSARYRISDSDGSVAQYLKQNMDFIKREIGKEVSNKEIEDFLNELVFVVNLPHEAQLRELLLGKLSSRLNKKFDYIGDNQIFCNNLLKKISDWVKDIKARPLSYKEGEELF